MTPTRPSSRHLRNHAVGWALVALIAVAAHAQTRSSDTSGRAASASIYGESHATVEARQAVQPTVALEARSSPFQTQGLPADGLTRRTDTGPTCRTSCAAQWYLCGPGTGDCTAARTVCLAGCVTAPVKFGFFGAPGG